MIDDWTREQPRRFWDPSRRLVLSIRAHQYWSGRTGISAWFLRKWAVFRHRIWSVVTGAEIPVNARIGRGLTMPHPNGIVIHPNVEIGVNCMIFQQVTIGTRGHKPGLPTIEDDVEIGAGAKILGPVRIGSGATIGANAVVIADVPARAVAVGIPARIVEHDQI